MRKKLLKIWGFSIPEVMLSVTMIALLAGISIPVYQGLQNRNNLEIAANTTAHSLKRAEFLAEAMEADSAHGVYIQSGSITVFRGDSYATRSSGFDEIFTISPVIVPSGLSEIVFTKFSGYPASTGTITFTSNSGETRNLTINSRGMVSY